MFHPAPTDAQLFAAAQRLFLRDTTPEERRRVWKAARRIHREQKAGASISMRGFCLRLLTQGLRLPDDQAAQIVDQVLASDELLPELQQKMN